MRRFELANNIASGTVIPSVRFVAIPAVATFLAFAALAFLIPDAAAGTECAERGNAWDTVHFETFRKFSHPDSSETVTIALCWVINQDVLQVGPLATLDAKVTSSRYAEPGAGYESVKITIPHKFLNYWYDSSDPRQLAYKQSNELVLYQDDTGAFTSGNEPINIRLIVPHDLSLEYCEYSAEENCFMIYDIIRPSPYGYVGQIENNERLDKIEDFMVVIIVLLAVLIATVAVTGIRVSRRT